MSRQAHLPPRCPFQKKPVSRPIPAPILPSLPKESFPLQYHHKSSSRSSILEAQPDWLDDVLGDPALNSKGNFHCRSVRDSVAFLDELSDSFSTNDDGENPVGNETCGGLESASMYGPNSPRRRSSSFSENAIVLALSDSVPEYPLPFFYWKFPISGFSHLDAEGYDCGSFNELNGDTKTAKRHTGPRSRVRKLQYIAELEEKVNFFQSLASELSLRIQTLLQQHLALSLENNELKQQMARLQEERLIMEDQYHSLMKEAERLETKATKSTKGKVRINIRPRPTPGITRWEDSWQVIDMEKLNLNRY
ncbi:hypothetical protein CFOL_v3_06767 [Cephalotus follicularis]|uniref:BZIP_1 domain-containing protein n=1 Tax=Cephalotus follicularis TaxID=3775 RepID=A0A1Q3B5F9_CEPFO|nr:hypothetical protein CFOL_v3_06767 [Cephalotus follicularis]